MANCCLKGLKLVGGSTLLNGVKGNCSITNLAVSGESIYHMLVIIPYCVRYLHVWVWSLVLAPCAEFRINCKL